MYLAYALTVAYLSIAFTCIQFAKIFPRQVFPVYNIYLWLWKYNQDSNNSGAINKTLLHNHVMIIMSDNDITVFTDHNYYKKNFAMKTVVFTVPCSSQATFSYEYITP